MSQKFDKLTQIARETKEALYGEWKKKQYFEDCNNFYDAGRGILAEAMGLTSVMLLYVGFAENSKVYNAGVCDAETQTIVANALNYIYDSVASDGYTVMPLIAPDVTEGIIDKNHPYVDTLTWVLSSSVLTVYAIRKKWLVLDEALEQKAIELIADSLALLANGQLECGAWGFSADKAAKKSLYSTYAVAASLADFLDYIFRELEMYDETENHADKKEPQDFYDWQTVNAINNYYRENPKPTYPKDDVTEMVSKMKSDLQMWLLENCLPLLPKLSECVSLDADEMERIGMVAQSSKENLGGKEYINLYYTHYIIDILITSSSDQRFSCIAEGRDTVTLDALKQSYQAIMSESDFYYFFEEKIVDAEGKHTTRASLLCTNYINQAIHSARTNFSAAMRSGDAFWTNEDGESELIIPWEHTEITSQKIRSIRKGANITEPALVPMALRANTVYCYYIIECADNTVDQLFDIICEDRSPDTKTVRKDTSIKNLWDNTNYSLPITERAIEALVDYSDYLAKYESGSVSAESVTAVTLDAAVDHKIAEYLSSDAGTKLLDSMGYARKDAAEPTPAIDEQAVTRIVEERVEAALKNRVTAMIDEKLRGQAPITASAPTQSSAFDVDRLIQELEYVQQRVSHLDDLPSRDAEDYCERLAYAFLELHKLLSGKHIQEIISEHCRDNNLDPKPVLSALENQTEELVDVLCKNCTTTKGNIAGIYRSLIAK